MTLNQFIASIRAFAENHYQINRFGTGPFSYIEKDLGSSASYPYLWVVVESVQVRQATLLLRTRFTVLDSMREDDSNLQDVWSDTQQIVLDCFNYLKRQTEELDVEGFPTIIPIQEKLTEYVGGMGMTIDVVVDYDSSCNMPLSEMPEFVDVAGPDFITCEDLQYCETIVDLTSRLVAAESTLINIGLSTDELSSRMSYMETLVPGGYTQGSVLIADASGNVSQDHSGLYFNASTNSLGIGSSNPLWNLYVNGMARITSTLMVGSKVTDNNTWNNLEFVDGNTIAMNVHNVSITRWLASGSFLIGTTSDLARLSVVSGGSTNATKALAIQNSSAASLLTVYDDGTKYFSQGSNIFFSPTLFRTFTEHQNGNSAYFYNSGNTTYYRLNNQGNVYTLQHLSGGNILTMSNTGQMNGSDLWRVTNQLSTPTSGSGIELYYQPGSTLGKIQAYDRSTSAYRTLGLDGSTVWMNANSGGSVVVGDTSGTARFQVQGTGSTNATTNLILQNSTSNQLLKIDDAGGWVARNGSGTQILTLNASTAFLNIGQWAGFLGIGSYDGTNNSATGLALRLTANTSSQAMYSYYFRATNQRQPVSGSSGHIQTSVTFNPTSGTAEFNHFELSGDVNQTGGANGIVRGLYINIGLTSAAEFRAIQTVNNTGYSIYASGTAPSYFGGKVTFATDIQTSSTGAFYLGDSNTDGTWKFVRSGSDLLIQRREGGSYVTKQTFTP